MADCSQRERLGGSDRKRSDTADNHPPDRDLSARRVELFGHDGHQFDDQHHHGAGRLPDDDDHDHDHGCDIDYIDYIDYIDHVEHFVNDVEPDQHIDNGFRHNVDLVVKSGLLT